MIRDKTSSILMISETLMFSSSAGHQINDIQGPRNGEHLDTHSMTFQRDESVMPRALNEKE